MQSDGFWLEETQTNKALNASYLAGHFVCHVEKEVQPCFEMGERLKQEAAQTTRNAQCTAMQHTFRG